MPSPFHIYRAAEPIGPVIFAAPHSGRDYPADFVRGSDLDMDQLRSSEDLFVDLLVSSAPRFGSPLIVARYPRAYLDLNRAPTELDPALIDGLSAPRRNPRVAAGLGVVPRVVSEGRVIRQGKISLDEAEQRIDQVWRPYHMALAALIEETHARFGWALLVDWHSMPHDALSGMRAPLPQVVIGDRYGASAAPAISEHVQASFEAAGLRVGRNSPFAGAYITKTYGQPQKDVHCIQIEIDRALYADSDPFAPGPKVAALERQLRQVIADICAVAHPNPALAAQ